MGSRGEPVLVSPGLAGRLFHFVMIKPTHYDDDGYPILWFRTAIPSNTLACLNGLAEDAHRRKVLGPGHPDQPDRQIFSGRRRNEFELTKMR